jgi:hypothetical protein
VRLQDEGVLIDPRTLLPGDEEVLAKALQLVVSNNSITQA